MSETLHLLAINVGNTRTSLGVFRGRDPISTRSVANSDRAGVVKAAREMAEELGENERTAVAVATVHPAFSDALLAELEPALSHELFRVGDELPVPLQSSLGSDSGVGQDRLLAALGAYETTKQACVVVDAGTAMTVDFVDGAGVFQGGAIVPGARMMLRSLHQGCAQLPEIELARPAGGEPFGKNTREAMLNGAVYGARGVVRIFVERYAERYGGYPMVIATGGDARLLFEGEELVERIVDDLVLRGIAIACDLSLSGEFAEGPSEDADA